MGHGQLDVHTGLLGLGEDGRRIGLLERDVFQVNALNLEDGVGRGLLFGHGGP